MRGVSSKTLVFALEVILLVVILGAAIGWLIPNVSAINWEDVWHMGPEGKPSEIHYDEPPVDFGWDEIETKEVDHTITDEGEPHQLSEVACAIANDIYNDFKKGGNIGDRKSVCGRPQCCYVHRCLVNIGAFSLDSVTLPTPPEWETTLSTKYPGCHVCDEITNLDEICINYNLDRTVDSKLFCDGFFVADSGDTVRFGNCNCKTKDNGDDWKNSCDGYYGPWWSPGLHNCGNTEGSAPDDFCDNDKEMIKWIADVANSDPEWLVKDRAWDENSNFLDKTPHKYVYGVFFRPKIAFYTDEEQYEIIFERIPAQGTETSFDFIKNYLKKGDRITRYNWIGNYYPQARAITDMVVTLGGKKSVMDLMEEIATEAGLTFPGGVKHEFCSGEDDCLNTDINPGTENCVSRTTPNIESNFLLKEIILHTPIDPNDDFIAGKKYRVVIKNWWGKYPKCYDAGWFGSACYSCFSRYERSVIIYEVLNCVDTDGGNDKTVKGTCTDIGGSYTDTCTDSTHIGEYFCSGNSCVGDSDTNCPPEVPNCIDGACVS